MVHLEDVGSQFDAPIDLVWKFLQSPDDHSRSHTNRRNVEGAPAPEGGMTVSWEQNVNGTWVKVVNHVTHFAPVAVMVHNLEGPIAGSKFLFYYTPHGAKTGVAVVGDFQSKMIPPGQLEAAVLQSLDEAFQDDNAALKRLAGRA